MHALLTSEDPRTAHQCFAEAVKLEPTYALAHAAKADAEFREATYRPDAPPRKWIALAEASAREALFWSPQCWRAHVVLGAVHCSSRKSSSYRLTE